MWPAERIPPHYASMLRMFYNLEGVGLFYLHSGEAFGVSFRRCYTRVSVFRVGMDA